MTGHEDLYEVARGAARGAARRFRQRAISSEFIERMKARTRRALADIDYLLATPLGWREGGMLV